MTMRHRTPAIVLSMCVNGLGVARSLGRHGVPVIGVTHRRDDPGVHSRYVCRLWRHEPAGASLVDLMLEKRRYFDAPPVLFPTSDEMVRDLAARWDQLAGGFLVRLPDRALVEETMSKRGFAAWVERLGLPAPKTAFVDDPGQIRHVARDMTYPCVVKPEFQSARPTSGGSLKVVRAENPEELIQAYLALSDEIPRAVVQEWIPGGDGEVFFCLQYYDDKSLPLASFCGRKIRQWPPHVGSTASCEPVVSLDLVRLTTAFFSGIGFKGLCSMEYKRDPRDGRLRMIEPTIGRTDFQSAVADINGVPIPYIAYCDLVGATAPKVQERRRRIKWVRLASDWASAKHYRGRKEISLLHYLRSIRPPMRPATWSPEDPMPLIADMRPRLRRKVRGALRRLGLVGSPNPTGDAVPHTAPSLPTGSTAGTTTGFIGKTWAYYRQYGLRSLVHRIHRRRRFVIYTKCIAAVERPKEYPDVEFRVAGPDDVPLLSALDGGSEEVLGLPSSEERLASGDLALIGAVPDDCNEVMYVSWVCRNDPLFRLLFGDGADWNRADRCSRRMWVPERYRRQGLARRGLAFAEWAAAQAGVCRLWAFILRSNRPSVALHRGLGYEEYGTLRVGRCLGKRVAELRCRGKRRWHALPRHQQGEGGASVVA